MQYLFIHNRFSNRKIPVALLLLVASFIPVVFADTEHLIINDAWIAEAPPVSKVMVSYMIISNTGEKNIEIINAESELYSSIEFHETVHEDGMARMIRHKNLTIPPGKQLELKRGGPHLMLFNPTKRLLAGDIVKITLTTKNHGTRIVSVVVKKAQF